MRIRTVDDLFSWPYLYFLESEMLKRKVLTVGPQEPDGPVTVHAKLPTDWSALSQRMGPYDNPGPPLLPRFAPMLGETPLAACLEHTLTRAVLNFDVMGNPHPAPTRPDAVVLLLFMSSRWPQELGGEVFFYDDESRRDVRFASSPLFNRAIVFDGAIPYAVRPPTKAAVFPRLMATLVMAKGPRTNELLGAA